MQTSIKWIGMFTKNPFALTELYLNDILKPDLNFGKITFTGCPNLRLQHYDGEIMMKFASKYKW